VRATPPDAAGEATVEAYLRKKLLTSATATGRRLPGGYELRIRLPLKVFGRSEELPSPDFLAAGRLRDVDEPGGPEAEILWRGSPAIGERNTGYATFFWED
jgi:hypothetical protein